MQQVRTTIDLPEDLHRVARSIARDRGATLSEVVAELMHRGLGRGGGRVTFSRSDVTGLTVANVHRTVTQDDVRSLDDDDA